MQITANYTNTAPSAEHLRSTVKLEWEADEEPPSTPGLSVFDDDRFKKNHPPIKPVPNYPIQHRRSFIKKYYILDE